MSSEQLILDGAPPLGLARPRSRAISFLPVVVPSLDVVALLGAIALTGHMDRFGLSFALAAALFVSMPQGRNTRIAPRVSDEVGWLVGRLAIPTLASALAVGWDRAPMGLLWVAPTSAGLLMVGRAVAYSLNRTARAHGLVIERTLILGGDPVGSVVASVLLEHAEFGLEAVGFIDSGRAEGLPLPLLGDATELERAVEEYGIRRVIVTFSEASDQELVGVLRSAQRLPIRVHVVPRLFELGAMHGPLVDDLWGIPVVLLRRTAQDPVARFTKRALDVLLASVAILIASPLLAAATITIRLTSGKPILFRQTRIGRHGRPFQLLKFRTLPANDECDTEWIPAQDRRLSGSGRFLRRTGLDELPQLFNVLRGEMSVVGPRPERPYFVDRFRQSVPRYDDRHRVSGGITGWAQIHGRSRDISSIPERVRFDNHYIEHWSVWTDLVILARTVKHIVTETGR